MVLQNDTPTNLYGVICMRGIKAKRIRKVVYGDHGSYRYREYVESVTSQRKPWATTRFADEKRDFYQAAKGRKAGYPGI